MGNLNTSTVTCNFSVYHGSFILIDCRDNLGDVSINQQRSDKIRHFSKFLKFANCLNSLWQYKALSKFFEVKNREKILTKAASLQKVNDKYNGNLPVADPEKMIQ